ncbi:glycerophosphodiester phosphodiesterase [Rhodanobacter sp. C03]|uniref:glycerophosphodiester phosphodiesterase n=1 Tax=Rhodanobacter sp. C03 TaxID=1945858 RepID=UPI0009862544|nr:glycerophosphodiester phosphodiesterase [Rhodanobacter sp. C03]
MSVAAHAHERPLAAKVLVIGHRGAPAWRPEHTLASYARAIADGADFIEPDLVMTKDGVLVARHENEIGGTTDVASHPEFALRRSTRVIDGQTTTGWFTEDFTLAELKTLCARERLPQWRSTQYDGEFEIPTLEEIIELAASTAATGGRMVGIIPEIKHGSYFAGLGLAMEERLLATLAEQAYTRHAPVEIQSFEIGNLRYLRERLGAAPTNIRLLQLLGDPAEQPWDVAGGKLDYARMMTPDGLREVAAYADAIGPHSRAIVPLDAAGRFATPTALVHEAHAAGLEVHTYTFRPENHFLPRSLWRGDDPASFNEAGSITEIRACLDAGIDAFFTDAPAIGRKALDAR